MNAVLRIGSRGSKLALIQTQQVRDALASANPGLALTIEIIRTTGDKLLDTPLAKIGDKGLFVKELETALLEGRVDVVVHSAKDLPTELPEGLVLAAVPEREDARDAVVGRKLADLPPGAKVGTSSLRRAAQLRQLTAQLVQIAAHARFGGAQLLAQRL